MMAYTCEIELLVCQTIWIMDDDGWLCFGTDYDPWFGLRVGKVQGMFGACSLVVVACLLMQVES